MQEEIQTLRAKVAELEATVAALSLELQKSKATLPPEVRRPSLILANCDDCCIRSGGPEETNRRQGLPGALTERSASRDFACEIAARCEVSQLICTGESYAPRRPDRDPTARTKQQSKARSKPACKSPCTRPPQGHLAHKRKQHAGNSQSYLTSPRVLMKIMLRSHRLSTRRHSSTSCFFTAKTDYLNSAKARIRQLFTLSVSSKKKPCQMTMAAAPQGALDVWARREALFLADHCPEAAVTLAQRRSSKAFQSLPLGLLTQKRMQYDSGPTTLALGPPHESTNGSVKCRGAHEQEQAEANATRARRR